MERPKIVVVVGPHSLGRQIDRRIKQYWSNATAEVLDSFAERVEVHLRSDQTPDERAAQVDAALADADGMVLRGWGPQGIGYLSAERLAKASRLRYIGSTCHYAQAKFIDVEAAIAQGIAISETAPVMSPFVAEYELALVLGALRNLPQEHATVGANGWVRWGDHPELAEVPERLHGRRVGLAGFGEIHRQLALMLAPFHTDWEAFDPYIPAERIEALGGRKVDDLAAMAERSEVFCIAIPPTPETIGIINRDVISALPRDCGVRAGVAHGGGGAGAATRTADGRRAARRHRRVQPGAAPAGRPPAHPAQRDTHAASRRRHLRRAPRRLSRTVPRGPPALRRRTAALPPAPGDGRYLRRFRQRPLISVGAVPQAAGARRREGVRSRRGASGPAAGGSGRACQAQPGSSAAQRSYTGSACPASLLRVRYHNADQVS